MGFKMIALSFLSIERKGLVEEDSMKHSNPRGHNEKLRWPAAGPMAKEYHNCEAWQ
jgi:hypothetical protein